MNPNVDTYFIDGCGRCFLGGTPKCKVHRWHEELQHLRRIVLDCDLNEELKWSQPCYTHNNKNILILGALKEYCAIGFFKGALLHDSEGILVKPGENSQSVRQFRYTNVHDILEQEAIVRAYIFEAIEIEKAGLKVEFKKTAEVDIPEELQAKLQADPAFKLAFESLTPGRQRGYILYFSQAKQSKTRIARIEKFAPKIFLGKGLSD